MRVKCLFSSLGFLSKFRKIISLAYWRKYADYILFYIQVIHIRLKKTVGYGNSQNMYITESSKLHNKTESSSNIQSTYTSKSDIC